MVSHRSEDMTQLAEKVQEDASRGVTSRFFSSMGVQDAHKWAEAYQDATSSATAFERATALNASVGLRQDIDPVAVGHLATREGWKDELFYQVSEHHLNMTELEEKAVRLAARTGVSYEEARTTQAVLMLAQGSHESRMALAERLAAHGFGGPGVKVDDAERYEGLVQEGPTAGAAAAEVQQHVHRLDDTSLSTLPREVAQKFASASDLQEQGETAVREFFSARKEGNLSHLDAAQKKLESVITQQRAQHYEDTFSETRGLLKAVHDFDYGGQIGDFDINLSALKEAGHAFASAQSQALAAGVGWKSAVWVGLSAAFRGYGKGFDQAVQARHDRAREVALQAGLPQKAAEFYADESVVWQQGMDVSIPRMLGRDQEYEHLKSEVKQLVGDKAFTMLERGAKAEPVAKSYYLEGAASIYKQRASSHSPEKPTPVTH